MASAPSSSNSPVVSAGGLRMTYRGGSGSGAVEALKGVTFDLQRGECLGLIGVNGSGKSTTLKIVLGLVQPTAGTIAVFGGPAGRRDARARTGYVPEEARRFGSLTGIETVNLFAALQGVGPRRERRRRSLEALDLVGLEPAKQKQRVAGYSRGMARRLAMATAWVHRPELLVLDEPTSGLDPFGAEGTLALLDRHRKDGGATLISTHERVTAEGACDRAIVLSEGRVEADGALAEMLQGDTSPSLIGLLRDAGSAARA